MCDIGVARCESVGRGRASWLEVGDELLFVVHPADVTQDGADSLASCWRAFVEDGTWRWRQDGGSPIEVVYARLRLPDGIAVRVTSSPGLVCTQLSPEHFTPRGTRALQAVARECAKLGYWQQHVPFPATIFEEGLA
jgi:hypothetical protein